MPIFCGNVPPAQTASPTHVGAAETTTPHTGHHTTPAHGMRNAGSTAPVREVCEEWCVPCAAAKERARWESDRVSSTHARALTTHSVNTCACGSWRAPSSSGVLLSSAMVYCIRWGAAVVNGGRRQKRHSSRDPPAAHQHHAFSCATRQSFFPAHGTHAANF